MSGMNVWRRLSSLALTAMVTMWAAMALGQRAEYGLEQGQIPVFQVGMQYDATHANAPPSGCGCFWMQGGGLQFDFTLKHDWSALADIYGAGASKINGTDERLSIFNYVFGPRYSLYNRSKYTPYAQALVGGSEVYSNFDIYGKGRTFFAAQAGGGLDIRLSRHVSVVPVEANYVYSEALNGVNSRQNNLRLSAGITFRIGER